MNRQLLYRSGQLYEFTASDMIRLLLQSREDNARRGVGGMLALRDGLFMQLLEGPAEVVDALFSRIAADPRHCEVRLLVRGERAEPLLPGWRMAWAEAPLGEGETATFAGLDTDRRALVLLERAGDDPVARTLRAFLHGEPVPPGGLVPAAAGGWR
ncbi:BLUF domain-containing protein [Luteimonas sp. FCS-9]|uniref:BLUF domain-containing protein n=1 Tax=Luteimonas sp. FCS-9 TaxID=1547516 RepID=UPI00069B0B81|nr:BLUF domain-containing protein [Luteimonas sp. FCS-9]